MTGPETESMFSSDKLLFILLLHCFSFFFLKTAFFQWGGCWGEDKSLTQVITTCNVHLMPPGCPMVLSLIHVLIRVDGGCFKAGVNLVRVAMAQSPAARKWVFPVCSAQLASEKLLTLSGQAGPTEG